MVPAKDFPNLIGAFQQARKEAPEAELWIAGAPADAKVVVSADGVVSHVFLMAGESGFAGACALARLASRHAGAARCRRWVCAGVGVGGNAAGSCEAMAMEKPVVATDVGGVRELVGDAWHAGSGKRSGGAGGGHAGNDAAEQ